MKLITAIVRESRLDRVREALLEAEISRITVGRVSTPGTTPAMTLEFATFSRHFGEGFEQLANRKGCFGTGKKDAAHGAGLSGMQTRKLQSGSLIEALCNVKCLHGLTGGAFHQVVEGADDDQPIAVWIAFKTDVAVVTAGEDFRLRIAMDARTFLDDAYEGFIAIGRTVQFPHVFLFEFSLAI